MSAKMGYDKVARSSRRRRRVHRFRRHVLPDAPEGLRRAARPRHQVHPHRPDPQRSSAHEAHRPRRGSVRSSSQRRTHTSFTIERLWDLRQEARPRERRHSGMGGAAQLASADQGAHATHLADYLEEFETQRDRERRARPLGARRGRAQPDRLRHPRARMARKTLVKSKSMLTEECDMRPFLETARHRGDRDRSRRAHPAARRRAAEPYRRAGGPQAARPTWPGSLRAPSAPTRATATSTISPRAQRQHDAALFSARRSRHDRAPISLSRRPAASSSAPTKATPISASTCPSSTSPRSASRRSFPGSSISACSCACCPAVRSARRSRSYTSHFRAPRAGAEMHIVLVDNGRSERLGMARFLVFAEMHPLRGLHEYMPRLSPQRRAELWRHLLRSNRRHHRSDLQSPQIQQPPFRFHAERELHECLPGQDQHPRADLQMAAGDRRAQSASVREEER